jgi:predicted Zn-dependent peptidase
MILAAGGRIEHETLVALAEEKFADLPTGGECVREPGRYVGGDWRDDRDLEQVHVLLGFEGVGYRDADFYAMSILSTLLGGGMSSRLFQEIRENRGLVYSIYTFPASYSDSGLFGIYAGTGESEIQELVPLICDEVCKISEDVSDTELARARAQLKSSILMSLESTTARCEQLARQLMIFGRPLSVDEIVDKISAVDAETVKRVARRLTAGQPTLAAMGPIAKMDSFEDVMGRLS